MASLEGVVDIIMTLKANSTLQELATTRSRSKTGTRTWTSIDARKLEATSVSKMGHLEWS